MISRSISLSLALLLATACNRGSEKSVFTPKDANDPLELTNSLTTSIPSESAGFVYFDNRSPAYQKLTQSQWGSDWKKTIDAMRAQGTIDEVPLLKAFQDVGIIEVGKDNSASANEMVGFVVPAQGKELSLDTLDAGLIVLTKPELKIGEKLTALQERLKTVPLVVSPLTLTDGSGFSAYLPPATSNPGAPAIKAFVGWSGEFVAITSTETRLTNLLANKKANVKQLPDLVKTDDFKKVVVGLSPADSFGLAYFDVARVIKAMPQEPTNPTQFADLVPVRTALLQMRMDDAPAQELRATIEPKDQSQKDLIAAMPSMTSAALLSAIPSQPMAYVSFNAEFISRAMELSEASKPLLEQFPILRKLKRVGIAGKAAPLGQSILPIPDLLVAIESSDGAALLAEVSQLAEASIKSSGVPAMPAAEKDIEGVKVKQFVSPMGIGLSLAAIGNVMLVSNSETHVREAIISAKGNGGAFANALPAKGKQLFVENKSVANLYVNFPEIASLMENLGGVMQMYGGEDASKNAITKESIESLKQQGKMLASVTVNGELFSVESVYVK